MPLTSFTGKRQMKGRTLATKVQIYGQDQISKQTGGDRECQIRKGPNRFWCNTPLCTLKDTIPSLWLFHQRRCAFCFRILTDCRKGNDIPWSWRWSIYGIVPYILKFWQAFILLAIFLIHLTFYSRLTKKVQMKVFVTYLGNILALYCSKRMRKRNCVR